MSEKVEREVRAYLDGKSILTSESVYRLIYEAYSGRLYSFIESVLKNKEDAEDVAQNVWIKVFRHLGSFKGTSSLYTWIYRIGYNECMNWKNSREYEKSIPFDAEVWKEDGLIQIDINTDEALKWLIEAIEKLPPRQKAVFNLRYYEELTYEQIAEITGITEGALKASFHHAMQKVENYLIKKLNEHSLP